jgi:integrase/recombinase XerC/integrase/recombinase XerD
MKKVAIAAKASTGSGWGEALLRFDRDLRRRGAGERARRAAGREIGALALWAANLGLDPEDLDHAWLRRHMEERGADPRTVRAFYRVLFEHGDLVANPADVLPLPSPPRPPRRGPAEVARLLDRIPAATPLELRDRALFELARATGLGTEALRRLDVDDVEGLACDRYARRSLDRYLDRARGTLAADPSEPALFLTKSGHRLAPSDVRRRLRTWARHLAAQDGAETPSSPRTTYTRLQSARLRAAYARSHPRA